MKDVKNDAHTEDKNGEAAEMPVDAGRRRALARLGLAAAAAYAVPALVPLTGAKADSSGASGGSSSSGPSGSSDSSGPSNSSSSSPSDSGSSVPTEETLPTEATEPSESSEI